MSTVAQKKTTISVEAEIVDREDLAAEACHLADLVEWVIQAHATLNQVRIAAEVHPKLGDAIRSLAIPIRSPGLLEQDVVSGLNLVFVRQRALIAQLGGVQP